MKSELNVVEASISDLRQALASGSITSVELVVQYLQRISAYDCRGPALNSIPLLNPSVFDEAAASDDRRATGLLPIRPLEGIPYTAKDSYKVKGLTVAAGSPAFQSLISNKDAFIVAQLREAGAVLIGQTNTPPMMYGGMQRGLYGRAENPYNLDYLTAAFASGSSNGSGTSTAASFAAFGMGSETVSSGRSPASNNALIAYTPSRGLISPRGIWPLYPTCDVVVPHTRSMSDLFDVLNVIGSRDDNTEGDLWREQSYIHLPTSSKIYPPNFHDLATPSSLQGKRIAVPEIYIGRPHLEGQSVTTRQSVLNLWENARADLQSLGAVIIPTPSFPIVTNYERETLPGQRVNIPNAPENWNSIERGPMIAHAWNDFLVANADHRCPSLAAVDTTQIWPTWDPKSVQVRYSEPSNAIRWADLAEYIKADHGQSMLELPGLEQALRALEAARKRDLEDWLEAQNLDFVVFPANGDIGKADADVNDESSKHAWMNGVKYSNGNRAIRHLGVPTVSVPMGIMEDTGMPVNLTFASKAYDDANLLSYAYAYEQSSRKRKPPTLTPELKQPSDYPRTVAEKQRTGKARPKLAITRCEAVPVWNDSKSLLVDVQGTLTYENDPSVRNGCRANDSLEYIHVYVNGVLDTNVSIYGYIDSDTAAGFKWKCTIKTLAPLIRDEREQTEAKVARDQTMVVVVAKNSQSTGGGASGTLRLI